MTDTTTPAGTDREHLEAERDFLLRSLDDLEAERADGAIDRDAYERLHDDYTARAAAVLRALRDGVDARPAPPPPPARRRALIFGGVVAFATLAGVALAAALGARLPGQTSSGNSTGASAATASTDQTRRALESSVAKNPDDVPARLQLALILERSNDLRGALEQYDAITKLDPSSAEAEAQAGRILYLTAQASPADAARLVTLSKARLDRAVLLDPQYPDAHFFRAIVLANEFQDYAGAVNECQRYLLLAPNGPWADSARQLLAQATRALASPPTTSPTPPRKATP
jgi:cytochrome c-type biogenesis protein CcmH/NrfG